MHIQESKARAGKDIHARGNYKKAGVAILISDKIDFRKRLTRNKEGHYIMIKESIQSEDKISDIYRHFIQQQPNTHSFFSSTHGTFYMIDYMIGHKTSLSKFLEVLKSYKVFLFHEGIKLEINNRNKSGKLTKMWKLNNTFLNQRGQRRNQN